MKSGIKKSTKIALAAAAAAVGVASQAHSQTITYVMAINDNGFGQYVPNDFAIYAIDGTVTLGAGSPLTQAGDQQYAASNGINIGTDGGIVGYGVQVTNAVTLRDIIQNGSTVTGHTAGGKNGKLQTNTFYTILPTNATGGTTPTPVQAGFTYPLGLDTISSIAGQQQQIDVPPPSYAQANSAGAATAIPVYGIGQTGGSMGGDFFYSAPTPDGTYVTGQGSGAPHTGKFVFSGPQLTSNPQFPFGPYLTGLLIGQGTYVPGNLPSLYEVGGSSVALANGEFEAANETYNNGYDAVSEVSQAFFGETLGVPEPTSVGLIGVGAMGLLARRRRREVRKA